MSRLAGGDQERETPDRILISKLFFKYVLPYKIAFSIALVVMLISVVFDLMGPYIIKIAIDDYIIPDKPFNLIILIAIFYVFVQAISFILEFIRLYIATVTGQKVVHQIRSDLIGNLQNLGMDYFDKNETGRIISKTTNDTERLSDLLTSGVLDVIVNSFQVIGILIILFSFDASLSLVTIFVTPIILLIIFVFRKKARPVYQLTRRTIGSVTASFQENISGITVSQIFNREEKNIDEFDKVNQDNFNARLKSIFIFSLLFPSLDAINGIAVAFIILIGANALLTGSSTITVGVLVAYLSYMTRYFRPILIISMFYNQLQSGLAATERIFDLLEESPSIQDRWDGGEAFPIIGNIEFQNVSFGYSKNQYVLKDINFSIPAGQTLALVGHTGAGKTTISNLLGKFYPFYPSDEPFYPYSPTEQAKTFAQGTILVDNIPLEIVNTRYWRENLGIVPQDGFLFSGTIRENICYGKPDATEDEIIDVARKVGAWEFIESLPFGLDTQVGERGGRLSHGERQLICFARALLPDPPIFILDEATSSIDAHTELIIQKSLEKILRNRTSIVIAHRLSTIRNADNILVLDHGKIIESGNFNELMEKNGKFTFLYEKQFVDS